MDTQLGGPCGLLDCQMRKYKYIFNVCLVPPQFKKKKKLKTDKLMFVYNLFNLENKKL